MSRKTLWALAIIFIISLVLFQSRSCHRFPDDRTPLIASISQGKNHPDVWHKKKQFSKLRGVALVVHGLNLRPEKMGSIIRILNDAGVDVLNVSLHGHGSNYIKTADLSTEEARLESFRRVNYALWSEEVHRAYVRVRQRAVSKRVPVYFIGYSLGGLLGCDLLVSDKDVSFKRMILFAPALNVMIEGHLLKVLTPFPNLVIDSLSPPSYRTNDGTPMAAYKALFDAIEHFEENMTDRLNIPAVIFVDEKDEFISYQKLTALVRKGLTQWRIVRIRKDDADQGLQKLSHHLIIDEAGVGKDSWRQITEEMRRHLRD